MDGVSGFVMESWVVKLLSFKTYTYWLQKNMRYLYGLSGISFSVFAILLLF